MTRVRPDCVLARLTLDARVPIQRALVYILASAVGRIVDEAGAAVELMSRVRCRRRRRRRNVIAIVVVRLRSTRVTTSRVDTPRTRPTRTDRADPALVYVFADIRLRVPRVSGRTTFSGRSRESFARIAALHIDTTLTTVARMSSQCTLVYVGARSAIGVQNEAVVTSALDSDSCVDTFVFAWIRLFALVNRR